MNKLDAIIFCIAMVSGLMLGVVYSWCMGWLQ